MPNVALAGISMIGFFQTIGWGSDRGTLRHITGFDISIFAVIFLISDISGLL